MSRKLESTEALRTFIANTIIGVRDGDISIEKAAVIIKGGEVINDSLYSEIKAMVIMKQLGMASLPIGKLQIAGPEK